MKSRTIAFSASAAVAVAALASFAIGSPPVAMGLARSASPFDLARPQVMVGSQQVSQAILQPGDEISARSGLVRVQLREGDSLLVGKGSRVAFPAQDEIHVLTGDIASATTLARPSRVKAANLLFEAQGDTPEGSPSALAVSLPEPDRLTATAYDRVYSITDENGVQVAALGAGDTIRLRRNSIGQWIPTGFKNQAGAVEEAPEAGHEEGDRRKGFWLFRTPVLIGAAAAAALGAGYYALSNDDSNNNDNNDNDPNPPRFDDSPTAPDDHIPPDDPGETDYNPPDTSERRRSG